MWDFEEAENSSEEEEDLNDQMSEHSHPEGGRPQGSSSGGSTFFNDMFVFNLQLQRWFPVLLKDKASPRMEFVKLVYVHEYELVSGL